MQEFANIPHGENNIVTVAVLHKEIDRNKKMIIMGYNNENYFVVCGGHTEVYDRTTQGMMRAVTEYESCVCFDLMVQSDI